MINVLSISKINGRAEITVQAGSFTFTPIVSDEFFSIFFILVGQEVTVTITPEIGFEDFTVTSPNLPIGPFTSSPFTFTMPDFDMRLNVGWVDAVFVPVDTYGLKYFFDWKTDRLNKDLRLEILERDYTGPDFEKRIQNLNYSWGNLDQDPTTSIIGSKIVFDIIGVNDDYFEFLDGDNRKFKAVLKIDNEVFFTGYINVDRLRKRSVLNQFPIQFEATDGTNSFESFRFNTTKVPFPADTGIINLVSALNQTFEQQRKVNVCVNIWEDRMDNSQGMYEQFIIPQAAIFNDGEAVRYTDGQVIINENLFLKETIERLVNPFIANVFLWKNEWWVIGAREYVNNPKKVFRYNEIGQFEEDFFIPDVPILSCTDQSGAIKFEETFLETNRKFTEFTSILKLGVFDQAAQGGIFESKFTIDDFFESFAGVYADRRLLLNTVWRQVRTIPLPRNRQYSLNVDLSDVAYVSNSAGEYLELFKMTKPSGIADPDISYIEISSSSTIIPFNIVQESANTISFQVDFMLSRLDGPPVSIANQSFGVMINIGNSWLDYDPVNNVFDWVNSETIMRFSFGSLNVFNTLQIDGVLVPETGPLLIRLYQVINTEFNAGLQQLLFKIGYRNLRVNVEQTEGLALSEISYKSRTLEEFSRVREDYVTFIGDGLTANSQSAIKLLNQEFSESWTSFEVTSQPLQAMQVQALANIFGRKILRVTGRTFNEILDPAKTYFYDGKEFKVIFISCDISKYLSEVVLIEVV